MKKNIILLLFFMFFITRKSYSSSITFNNKQELETFLKSDSISVYDQMIMNELFDSPAVIYPLYYNKIYENKYANTFINNIIGTFSEIFYDNIKLLGTSYSLINNNQIDYIDIIKGREQKDGFKIRFINLNLHVYRKLIDEILNIKEPSNTNKEMKFYESIRTTKNLFKYIPAINGSIITFKYDYTFLDELKASAMLDINTNTNLLFVHLALTENINYSLGSWIEYTPKNLYKEFNEFKMTNSIKCGLFFTQKIYEFDFSLNIRPDGEGILFGKNKYYDTYNIMLFAKYDFNINFNDDSIYSWFINNINISDTIKLTNYTFNFKNPYFEETIHRYFNYFGKHNYTIIDNSFKLSLNRTFNFGKYFSITIPFGFNFNFDMYGSHNDMLKNSSTKLGKFLEPFEPFVGINIGIFGKTINFEYNRNAYRLSFVSRF